MDKIKIEFITDATKITLPPELITYFQLKKRSKFYIYLVSCDDGIKFFFSPEYISTWRIFASISIKSLSRTNEILFYAGHNINKIYTSGNIYHLSGTWFSDYTIYDSGSKFIIGAAISKKNTINFSYLNRGKLTRDVVKPILGNTHYSLTTEFKDEFFLFLKAEGNNVTYVTKQKLLRFLSDIYKKTACVDVNYSHYEGIEKISRTCSLNKLFKMLLNDAYNEKELNAYFTYNKMLSEYDPSFFKIVSGEDILKYYKEESYYKKQGELGSSCMRYESYKQYINFYAKNSNVSMLVMSFGDFDKIVARALIWTTTEGVQVMDRIYTTDTKLISLFHKYAENNNIVNIYNHKKWDNSEAKDITKMGPSNWKKDYDKQFIVDLEFLPKEYENLEIDSKVIMYFSRHIAVGSTCNFPYLDNFNIINFDKKQLSVLPEKNVFKCVTSDTYIDTNSNWGSLNSVLYNRNLVRVDDDDETLILISEYDKRLQAKASEKVEKKSRRRAKLADSSFDDFTSCSLNRVIESITPINFSSPDVESNPESTEQLEVVSENDDVVEDVVTLIDSPMSSVYLNPNLRPMSIDEAFRALNERYVELSGVYSNNPE